MLLFSLALSLSGCEGDGGSAANRRRQLPQRRAAEIAGGLVTTAPQNGQRDFESDIKLLPSLALAAGAADSYPVFLLHGFTHGEPLAVARHNSRCLFGEQARQHEVAAGAQ